MNRLFCALVLCALTACSSPTTPLGVACPALVTAGLLNYPLNGSVNIVDSENVIVVSAGPWTMLTLTSTSGPMLTSTQIVPVPSPLPQPNNLFQLSTATAFRIPMLTAATTYSVTAAFAQSGPCREEFAPAGSFTTK